MRRFSVQQLAGLRTRRLIIWFPLSVLLLLVASCSQPSAEGDGYFASGEYRDADSPLLELESYGSVSELTYQKELDVQKCMRERGFEYIVDPNVDQEAGTFSPGSLSAETVQEQGYGIVDSLTAMAQDSQDLGTGPSSKPQSNNELLETMNEDEVAIWVQNAWGEWDDFERTVDEPACAETVYGEPQEAIEIPPDLQARIEDVEFRVQSDPRVQAENSRWSECMYNKGYEFADSVALNDLLSAEIFGHVKFDSSGYILPETVPTLEALRPRELELAQADWDCQKDGDPNLRRDVRREYELDFIDENSDEIKSSFDASE